MFFDASQHYNDAFKGCDKKLTDVLDKWTDQVEDLTKIKDWDKISEKIYDAHQDEANQDITLEFKWWDSQVWYNSGMYAGRFQKIFLDNAPKETVQEAFLL